MKIRIITSLFAAAIATAWLFGQNNPEQHPVFRNDGAKIAASTAKIRAVLKGNPSFSIDSVCARVPETLTEGYVGRKADLKKPLKKKLDARKLFELCKSSSLLYCKYERTPGSQRDSAYTGASAVALTADGICATNYHVIAPIALSGALGKSLTGQLAQFVMDFDGYVYPVESILYTDPINDMAIIKVNPLDKPLTPANIGADAVPGTPAYCLANPSGATFHFTEGMVSNASVMSDAYTGQYKYILDITSDYGRGASGGPVYDDCGNLIGLISSTFSLYARPDTYRNLQMVYKYSVPVFLITERFE